MKTRRGNRMRLAGMVVVAVVIAGAIGGAVGVGLADETAPSASSGFGGQREIAKLLESCSHVPSDIARFIVIPTSPTGKKSEDSTLRFSWVLKENVAVTRYAVISEGLQKGVLNVYREKYLLLLAQPGTNKVMFSFAGRGVSSFDIEKQSVDEAQVAFLEAGEDASQVDWSAKGRTPALSGKCNLLNLVVLPAQTSNAVGESILLREYPVLSQLDPANYQDPAFAEKTDTATTGSIQPVKNLACVAAVYMMLARGRGDKGATIDRFYRLGEGAIPPSYVGARQPVDLVRLVESLQQKRPVVLQGEGGPLGTHSVLVVGFERRASRITLTVLDPWPESGAVRPGRSGRIDAQIDAKSISYPQLSVSFRFMRAIDGGASEAASSQVPAPVARLEIPQVPTTRMNDYASFLMPAERQRLEGLMVEGERVTKAQMVVALFRSLQGENLEEYSLRAANQWGVGRAGVNDGLVLFIFVEDKKMRLEVGKGLQGVITNEVATTILKDVLAPRLSEGRFGAGIEGAINAVFSRLPVQKVVEVSSDASQVLRRLAGRWRGVTTTGVGFVWTIDETGRYESVYRESGREVKRRGEVRVNPDGSLQWRAESGQNGTLITSTGGSGPQLLRGTISGRSETFQLTQVEARPR